MSEEPVVTLYPDNPQRPVVYTSTDQGSPQVVLRRDGAIWKAKFGRHVVAEADTPEDLTAHLFADHGLLAVLNENVAAA